MNYKHLFVKKSNIPGAGKGLFPGQFITKGTVISEYQERITDIIEITIHKRF